MGHTNPTDEQLRAILAATHTIAVVGASSRADRPSLGVMKTLLDAGFDVIPITPFETSVSGRTAYKALSDVPGPVDIVDVFRRAEDTPAVADEAVAIGAKVLWLQLGITNDEAARRASTGGLTVIMDLCIGRTVHRLGVKRAAFDEVSEASEESFPASDPPAWTPLHTGTPPRPETDRQ